MKYIWRLFALKCPLLKCVVCTKYLLQSDKTEQTLKIWLSVVIRSPPPPKKLLSRDMHCITYHKLDHEKQTNKKHEVNVISETNFITFANMYNCFTSPGYKLFLWKSIGYQFHNFLQDVVFIMVCYDSARLYLKEILELERGLNIASKVVPFRLKLQIL